MPPRTAHPGHNERVHISAKAEYAVRALLVMAADPENKPISGEMIARVGWDCLVADMQHSMTDFGEMVRLLQVTTNGHFRHAEMF